jgi:hypothetical protein
MLQLLVDAYALASHTASECQDARIKVDVLGLSRALEQTDKNALLTPGVEKKIEDAGLSNYQIN